MKMKFEQELEKCESEIERHLLRALYPELDSDAQKDIRAQYMIDYYDIPATLPDFAFPDLRISIYCDGYEYHSDRGSFQKDRHQSMELQLHGWYVLRLSEVEILNDTDVVVLTREKAIRRNARERADQQKRLMMRRVQFPVWGMLTARLVAAVVQIILVEYFAPTLFYHLTKDL